MAVIVDWNDPCQRAIALRAAYYRLISGEAESQIRYSTSEGEQEVRFQKIEIQRLKDELDAADGECALMNGTAVPPRSRRYAIRGGYRRSCFRVP